MEWVTVDEAARITGMHKVSVYRMAARLEGTEHTRKEGRRRLLAREYLEAQRAPLEAHKAPQTPPSPPLAPPDYVARLEARIDALEAERREDKERADAERMRWHATLNGLTDTIRELEARTADLVALNVRLRERPPALLQVQPQPATGPYRPEPEPAQATPSESPTASLTEWLRAMQLRRNEAHSMHHSGQE